MTQSRLLNTGALLLLCAAVFSLPANAQFETRIDTPFIWSSDDGAVAVADFNHDGNMDAVVADKDLQIFLGKGDGTFQAPIVYSLGGFLGSIALADFNGDGQTDIAVTNFLNSNVSVLFGNGDGTFQLAATVGVQGFPGFMTAGDFNNDGKPDFMLITGKSVTLFLNQGGGKFGVPKKIEVGRNTNLTGLGVGDFNRDGNLDLALSNDHGDGEIVILLGDGHGGFTESTKYQVVVGGVGPIGVGDFRGNGLLDLIVGGNSLKVYLGNGDGTFQPSVTYSLPSGSAAIADVNGDGKLDLIFAGVSVLLGNGDGTFQPGESFPTGISSAYVAVGDMNGDGMPDIMSIDITGDMFTQLNTGTAYFAPTSPVTFPSQLIGTTSTPMAAEMTNAGTTPITITSVTSSGGPFKITKNACTGALAPGAQCKISASFTPTVKDSVTGTLSIVDSASSKPQIVELTGPGTFVKLVPSALNFPATKVGTTSAPQTIQITNTASTALNFTGAIYVAGFYNDYPESNTCGNQLAAGASCTVTISFSPQKTGTRNSDLVIQDDGGGSPQQLTLIGTGD